jgi:hypothetical protein
MPIQIYCMGTENSSSMAVNKSSCVTKITVIVGIENRELLSIWRIVTLSKSYLAMSCIDSFMAILLALLLLALRVGNSVPSLVLLTKYSQNKSLLDICEALSF